MPVPFSFSLPSLRPVLTAKRKRGNSPEPRDLEREFKKTMDLGEIDPPQAVAAPASIGFRGLGVISHKAWAKIWRKKKRASTKKQWAAFLKKVAVDSGTVEAAKMVMKYTFRTRIKGKKRKTRRRSYRKKSYRRRRPAYRRRAYRRRYYPRRRNFFRRRLRYY